MLMLFIYYRLSILLFMFIYLLSTKFTDVNVYFFHCRLSILLLMFIYLLSTKYTNVNVYLFIFDLVY